MHRCALHQRSSLLAVAWQSLRVLGVVRSCALTRSLWPAHCGLVRYCVAHFGGGFLGALCFWALVDDSDPLVVATELFGCSNANFTHGQAFLAEFLFCFFVLWIAYSLVRALGA